MRLEAYATRDSLVVVTYLLLVWTPAGELVIRGTEHREAGVCSIVCPVLRDIERSSLRVSCKFVGLA